MGSGSLSFMASNFCNSGLFISCSGRGGGEARLKTFPVTGGDTAAEATLVCAQMKMGGDKEVLVWKQTQLENNL